MYAQDWLRNVKGSYRLGDLTIGGGNFELNFTGLEYG